MIQRDRNTYLGSADAKDIVSLEPHGCFRALVMRKVGIEPDNPREEAERETAQEGPMVAGKKLESLIVGEVAERLDVEVYTPKQADLFHPDREWLRASPDGISPALDEEAQTRLAAFCRITLTPWHREILATPGLIEAKKVQPAELWRIRKQGPREDHLLQVNHQFCASGLALGILAYLDPSNWRWAFYLIPRDEAWEIKSYLPACDAAWGQIQQAKRMIALADSPDEWDRWLPPRLKEGSKQCRTCSHRRTCWGMEYARVMGLPSDGDPVRFEDNPEWDAAASDLLAVREVIAEAEQIEEDAKARIVALLGDATVAEGAGVRIYYRPQKQKRLDLKALKAAHPEIAAKFEKETEFRALRVFQV